MITNKNMIHWVNLFYLLIVVISTFLTGNPSNDSNTGRPGMDPAILMVVAQFTLILIPSMLFVVFTHQSFKRVYKLERLSPRIGIYSFLIGLLCWPVFVFLSNLSQAILMILSPDQTVNQSDIVTGGGTLWIVFLGLVFIAPLCEEALNRGVLLSAYENRVGVHAVWMVAILFALLHLGLGQIFGAMFIGMVTGWLVFRTRSIWSGILVHMGTNILGALLALLMTLSAPNASESMTQSVDIASLMWIGALVWGGVSLLMGAPLYFLIRYISKRNKPPEVIENRLDMKSLWSFYFTIIILLGLLDYRLTQGFA